MNMGAHVRNALRAHGMSASDLARSLDVLPQQVYKWTGAKNLTADAIERITSVLHVPEFEALLDDPSVKVAGVQIPRSVASALDATDPALVREILQLLQMWRKATPTIQRSILAYLAAGRVLASQGEDIGDEGQT